MTEKKLFKRLLLFFCLGLLYNPLFAQNQPGSWIRINQLGYTPEGIKVAVLATKSSTETVTDFELIDANTHKNVFSKKVGRDFGKYGPFIAAYRLDFTGFKLPGSYYF